MDEDNCVLEKGELNILDYILTHYKKQLIPSYCEETDKIFLKIKKLNERTKNANKTGLSDKNDNSIFLDHICRDIDGKLFRVDYHAAAYWANYQHNKWELLGNVSEQCKIITTYEEDCKSENPIWKPPFKKVPLPAKQAKEKQK